MYDYKITGGPAFAEVTVNLVENQQLRAEAGAMSYMNGSIEMETKSGGIFSGIKRSFTGESFFQNIFTGPGSITLAPQMPGDIIDLEIAPDVGWIVQKDAYIAGSPTIEVSSKWGGFKSILGGEGAFLTHLSVEDDVVEKGLVFLGGFGSIEKHEVPAGQEMVLDTGTFFATPASTQFRTSKVGGMKSFFFGGEGLVMRFTGPCTVYTQSRGMHSFIDRILQQVPKS